PGPVLPVARRGERVEPVLQGRGGVVRVQLVAAVERVRGIGPVHGDLPEQTTRPERHARLCARGLPHRRLVVGCGEGLLRLGRARDQPVGPERGVVRGRRLPLEGARRVGEALPTSIVVIRCTAPTWSTRSASAQSGQVGTGAAGSWPPTHAASVAVWSTTASRYSGVFI